VNIADIAEVAAVMAYVAPGFVAVQLRYFLVPARKGSDFELLAWSVIFSVVGYALASQVYGGPLRGFAPRGFFVSQWLFCIAAACGVACVSSSKQTGDLLSLFGIDYCKYPSVWNESWQRDEGAPWVRLRLQDGSVCCGAVRLYTRDPAETQREILLFPVYGLNSEEQPTNKIEGVGLLVNAGNILAAEFLDWPDDPRHQHPKPIAARLHAWLGSQRPRG